MNVYDFDKTIYPKDSTMAFYFFCLKKHPAILRYIFKQGWFFALFAIGVIDKTAFKDKAYCFLKGLPDIDGLVEAFWAKNYGKIENWYLKQQEPDDLIISASPEFLLRPLCEKLGIQNLMASCVEKKTGQYTGRNCYGEEKVNRFREQFADEDMTRFYSDSLSDTPLAELAGESFIVTRQERMPWADYKLTKLQTLKKAFLSTEFIVFLFIGGLNTIVGVSVAEISTKFIHNVNLNLICGFIVGTVFSYILNSKLAFKESLSFIKYIKCVVSYLPNLLVQIGLAYVLNRKLGVSTLITFILTAILGIPITFLMLRFFTFIKGKPKEEQ